MPDGGPRTAGGSAGSGFRYLFAAILSFIVVGGEALASGTMPSSELRGFVRDSAGRLVPGAVLLVSPESAPADVKTATTIEDGSYALSGLGRGVYRLIAVKSGYASAFGRVNTLFKNTFDLVLRPRPASDPAIALDDSWMLRVPPRDMLRDLRAEVSGEGFRSGPQQPAERAPESLESALMEAALPLAGEFEQWFSGTSPIAINRDRPVADGNGSVTAVRLAMRLGERLDLAVDGRHGQEDLRADPHADVAGRTTSADHVGLSMGYDLDGLSRLDMKASYGRDSLAAPGLSQTGAAPLDSADGENVTRACQTVWKTSIGAASSLDVTALYVDSVSRAGDEGSFDGPPVANRLLRAGGQFQTTVGNAHLVAVGLRARMLRLDGSEEEGLRPLGTVDPISLAGPAPPGWALHLHGSEDWTVDPSVALNFGLDYHRSLSAREVQHLVPRAGLTVSPTNSTRVKAAMSYLVDSTTRPVASIAPADSSASSPRRTGYDLALEQKTGERTVMILSSSSRPIDLDMADERPVLPTVENQPTYFSDGRAESRETGIELRRRFRRLTANIGASRGRINGRYAASVPGEPLVDMHDGVLTYAVTSLSARTDDSGTEMRVELRTLRDRRAAGSLQSESRLSRLSITLAQDLPFVHLGDTRWRFLMACQNNLDSSETSGRSGHRVTTDRPLLTATDRLSGGVSIQF